MRQKKKYIHLFSHFADETSMCNQSKFDVAATLLVRGSRGRTLWQPFCVLQVVEDRTANSRWGIYLIYLKVKTSFNDENKLNGILSRA